MKIPFNKPHMSGRELDYIAQAHAAGHLAGNGAFTRKCHEILEGRTGCARAFLTHSGTAALEMASLLLDLKPGDEVVMPSFTFVSTANAFVLRGAVPVFVDIRPDTLNMDETKVSEALTAKTRAIIPVHYAGVSCEMDDLMVFAKEKGLSVVEDAAQALGSTYRGKALGSFGVAAAVSFHETKNVISGEGGACLVNDPALRDRADVVWQKGTNRARYEKGDVQKYEWMDLGSSFLPSEMTAAFLCAQLEDLEIINSRRRVLWDAYHQAFGQADQRGWCRRPVVPEHCGGNAHLYYLLLPDSNKRERAIQALAKKGIHAVFHYVPLHDSPAGRKYGRAVGDLPATRDISSRLLRLPLWLGLEEHQDFVIQSLLDILKP